MRRSDEEEGTRIWKWRWRRADRTNVFVRGSEATLGKDESLPRLALLREIWILNILGRKEFYVLIIIGRNFAVRFAHTQKRVYEWLAVVKGRTTDLHFVLVCAFHRLLNFILIFLLKQP